MTSIVTTLAEGRHFLGVAALYNSLVAAEFPGKFVVGHRGEVPSWFRQQVETLAPQQRERFRVEPVNLRGHLTNLKPHWLLQLLDRGRICDFLAYSDPDVCLVAPWKVMARWANDGIAVAENPSPPLHEGHWRLTAWHEAAIARRMPFRQRTPAYINGGFVGIPTKLAGFLVRWRDLIEDIGQDAGGLWVSPLAGGSNGVHTATRYDPFHFLDQDALNLAIRTGDEPIKVLAQDGMGFVPGEAFMTHAIGCPKPWQRRFVREALGGRKPSFADKTYFAFCHGPLRPFAPTRLRHKQATLKLACAIRGRGWS